MTDYLRLRKLPLRSASPELARWQVSEDLIELDNNWSETRKIRIFNFGPALKGAFQGSKYFPDGLDGAPPPPGAAGCEDRYNHFWNEGLDQVWSRISRSEFEERFAAPSILDRLSPLTGVEEQAIHQAHGPATYASWRSPRSETFPGFPVETLYEFIGDRVPRMVEIFRTGAALRDNLFLQRRRDFAIINFNGSLVEGSYGASELLSQTDAPESAREIDREAFEASYNEAAPKLSEVDWFERTDT